MTKALSYPPPFQDIATLARHICCSESTIENWMRYEGFPGPIRIRGSRRWDWEKVRTWMDKRAESGAASAVPSAQDIANATRAARQH